jgi:hydrogenase-4 component F
VDFSSLIIPCLVVLPLTAGIAALLIRPDALRRALLIGAAIGQLILALVCGNATATLGGWLAIDALGRLFLLIVCVLFLAASLYGIGYLARERTVSRRLNGTSGQDLVMANPEALLTACLLFFLAAMTLVCVSNHLGLLWVAVEATTLASAPMIYYHRQQKSLEAAWKYLLICSIGIALALLGNFLLAVSTSSVRGAELPLLLDRLIPEAARFQPQWLKAAFIFLLVGYGTKMGLAPLHTWLPDAHSESPSFVSALLSGALLNCAFLGILRAQQILNAAGEAAFGQELLIGFGLLSMGLAAVFIVQQPDFKRMLAYSSVEHMGILALGVGLGGAAVFGAMFHAVNHSLAKGMLFLTAGNILSTLHTKISTNVRGLSRILPVTAALWLAGFLAITGSPPFGSFLSEFVILKFAIERGSYAIATGYVLILAVIFIAMAAIVLRMVQGTPSREPLSETTKEPWLTTLPPLALGTFVLILGVYLPPSLQNLLSAAAKIMGGAS